LKTICLTLPELTILTTLISRDGFNSLVHKTKPTKTTQDFNFIAFKKMSLTSQISIKRCFTSISFIQMEDLSKSMMITRVILILHGKLCIFGGILCTFNFTLRIQVTFQVKSILTRLDWTLLRNLDICSILRKSMSFSIKAGTTWRILFQGKE
jgi:hypothetical protein